MGNSISRTWTLLIGLGFMLFGENILVGRFVELAAAFGSTYLTYLVGARFMDKNAGLFGAFFLSFTPIHLFYSTISKVYSLLCFLSLLWVAELQFLLQTRQTNLITLFTVSDD